MKNKLKRGLVYFLLILLIVTGVYIFVYYLISKNIADLTQLPPLFLAAVFIYIFAQVIKRFIQKSTPWYGWLYYIGILAVATPLILSLPLISTDSDVLFSITRYGSLFLFVPSAIEFFRIRQQHIREKLEEDYQKESASSQKQETPIPETKIKEEENQESSSQESPSIENQNTIEDEE